MQPIYRRCGRPTPYDINTPVHLCRYYIDGSGQLCEQCSSQLYSSPVLSDTTTQAKKTEEQEDPEQIKTITLPSTVTPTLSDQERYRELISKEELTLQDREELAKVNNITLGDWETIMMAKAAENRYVGVNCGKLDQSCEVLCRKDHLLYMDCRDDSYELIPVNPGMKPFQIAVLFSGLERSLALSAYNLRQDECKAAAYNLLAYAGMEYGKFIDTRLRDVPAEVFERYADRLPENFRKRAAHYFSEIARAEAGAEMWRKGDLDGYGKLVFASGKSSIENYECGCPELITLYQIMTETEGIYGGRFSGAGFKGCCMALIDPEKAEEIERTVTDRYLEAYPGLSGKYSFHLCDSAAEIPRAGKHLHGQMKTV